MVESGDETSRLYRDDDPELLDRLAEPRPGPRRVSASKQGWWERRDDFELFISQRVIDECRAGDPDAAALRLDVIRDLRVLDETDEAVELARALRLEVPLPPRATVDSFHIAIAVIRRMDSLLTWNRSHIAKAMLLGRIESVSRGRGLETTTICTPDQLPKED